MSGQYYCEISCPPNSTCNYSCTKKAGGTATGSQAGGPDNLNEVNRLTWQGVPLSEAVKRTWTAKQAKRHGYTEAIISEKETRGKPGEYSYIVITFHKKEEK